MFRKRSMITEEIHRALAELEDDDIEGVSVAITPPPMDLLTDEEDVNDENIPEVTSRNFRTNRLPTFSSK